MSVRHALAEACIAFEAIDDRSRRVASGPLVLGHFDERTLRITDANGYTSRDSQRV